MTNLFKLGFGQISAFIDALVKAEFTPEMAKAVIKRPALATVIVEALKRELQAEIPKSEAKAEDELVHGVFSRQSVVLAAFKARCAAKGIDFGKFSWIGSEVAPDFDPNDPETVVVLDATFGTLQETFEFAWAWTVDGQDDKWRYEGMLSDVKHLRLLSDNRKDDAEGDGPEFKPYTLRWVRIKLDTNVGKRPIDVRNSNSDEHSKPPGCALLFMSAEHPDRIKATDYEKRFGFWLPGLKCTDPGFEAWRFVPYVSFNRNNHQVELCAFWVDYSRDFLDLAVPSFRE